MSQHRVVPQVDHPRCYQEHSHTETKEQEQAVVVRAEPFLLLIDHDGDHSEEGEEEKLCDLSLCDQVP